MSRIDINWENAGILSDGEVANQQQADPYAESVKIIAGVAASAFQQAQLTKLNVERLRRGLAPISAEEYASGYQVPAAQVQMGLDPQTRQMLMYGALGVLGLFILKKQRII